MKEFLVLVKFCILVVLCTITIECVRCRVSPAYRLRVMTTWQLRHPIAAVRLRADAKNFNIFEVWADDPLCTTRCVIAAMMED